MLRIFISHMSEEAPLAEAIGDILSEVFGKLVDVFISRSIPFGANWLSRLGEELSRCDTVLVLFTPYSVNRPWINIEAGFGVFAGKHVVPLCALGLKREDLPKIYGTFRGLYVNDRDEVLDLLKDLGRRSAAGKLMVDGATAVDKWMQIVTAAAALLPKYRHPEGAPVTVWLMGSTTDFRKGEVNRAFDVGDALADAFIARRFRIITGKDKLLAYIGDKVAVGNVKRVQHVGELRLGAKAARADINPIVILGSLRSPRGIRNVFLDALGFLPDVGVLIGGRPGGRADDELKLAAKAGIPVLPIPFSGGAAQTAVSTFDESLAADVAEVLAKTRGVDDIGTVVCALIERQVAISRR